VCGLRHAPTLVAASRHASDQDDSLVADVPRIECAEHGVHQLEVPWSVPGSGFTALTEAVIIDWLKEANISALVRLLRLSWDEIDGIMQRERRPQAGES
jgi:hypothetical protein